MTEVVKIDGSPGAGKSYTLEQRLSVEQDNGVGLFDFWWLNFTTSGRKDVEPVLEDMFQSTADCDPSDRAKTVHGLALSLCIRSGLIDPDELDEQLIMQGHFGDDETDHFAKFCDDRCIPYNPNAANSRALLSGERETEATGNNLFAINDYLRQTYQSPDAHRDAPVDTRLRPGTVKRLLDEWDEYKRNHEPRLYEHGDYVQQAVKEGLIPDVEILLIDEFQDLAPLEYKLYKQWRDSGELRRIYISGDSNQSVYSFRGGTPRYFDGTDTDSTITLKESYRCPENISQVGHALLDAHEQTDPRGFGGKDDGGIVNWRSFNDKNNIRDRVLSLADGCDETPAVMLLTRTNSQLGKLANDLRTTGIPFQTLGSNGGAWSTAMKRVYTVLSGFGESDGYVRHNAQELFKRLPDGQELRRGMSVVGGRVFDADAIESTLLDGYADVLAIVDDLQFDNSTAWRRDVLRNALDSPGDLSPESVQIGTIHTAKGLEAPNVLLFANVTRSMLRRYRRRKDHAAEEHRVYYVGATRASERLTLVEDYFGGPIAEPIKRIRGSGVVA
jgi:superfamily I DNA/RNA helicase